MSYTIKETEPSEDDESRHIYAIADDGKEICGAYQPIGHDYWCLYVTKLVSQTTGKNTPPHREHFYGKNGRYVATTWVEMIAALYCLGTERLRDSGARSTLGRKTA